MLYVSLRESNTGCLLSRLLCCHLLAEVQHRQFDTPASLRPIRLTGANCNVASVTSGHWTCDLFLPENQRG